MADKTIEMNLIFQLIIKVVTEVIEVTLDDQEPWETKSKPKHNLYSD